MDVSSLEPAFIRLENVRKVFGHVVANNDVTLDLRAGSILALLGENGAGKSTLMSILSGKLQPDGGRILMNGEPVRLASPRAALDAGIGMVYQHFTLVESMTVAENLALGQEGGFVLHPRALRAEVRTLSERIGLPVEPDARIRELSMGERQRVEILKLLRRGCKALIFDEPTAVLTPGEAGRLFGAMRAMTRQGKAVVFISHKLEEVLAVADHIAVLRGGRVQAAFPASEAPGKAGLAKLMVGKEAMLQVERPPVELGETVAELTGARGRTLDGLNLTVRRGEIVAVVGVAGNGQRELCEMLAGMTPPDGGEVRLLGKPWREVAENPAWRRTMSYVPEDRLGMAVARNMTVTDNFLLTTRAGFTKKGLLDAGEARAVATRLAEEFNVRGGQPDATAGRLSGGNLQKLVLARELFRQSRLIVAEQPTQGLDVLSAEEVWKRLLAAREHAGVVLVTGDLAEAFALADRVAVLYKGRFMDVFDAADKDRRDKIGLLMAGVAA